MWHLLFKFSFSLYQKVNIFSAKNGGEFICLSYIKKFSYLKDSGVLIPRKNFKKSKNTDKVL
jgi:hypothetical protein